MDPKWLDYIIACLFSCQIRWLLKWPLLTCYCVCFVSFSSMEGDIISVSRVLEKWTYALCPVFLDSVGSLLVYLILPSLNSTCWLMDQRSKLIVGMVAFLSLHLWMQLMNPAGWDECEFWNVFVYLGCIWFGAEVGKSESWKIQFPLPVFVWNWKKKMGKLIFLVFFIFLHFFYAIIFSFGVCCS